MCYDKVSTTDGACNFWGLGFFPRNSLGPIKVFPKAPFSRGLTELGVPVSQIWQKGKNEAIPHEKNANLQIFPSFFYGLFVLEGLKSTNMGHRI